MKSQVIFAATLLCLVIVESRYPYKDTYRSGDIVPYGRDSRQSSYPYERRIGRRITDDHRDDYVPRRSDVTGGFGNRGYLDRGYGNRGYGNRGYGSEYYRRPRGIGGYNKYDEYGRYPNYRDYEYKRSGFRRDYDDTRGGYGGNNNYGGSNSFTGIGIRLD